jgi:uncharacterized protein with WD repeat
VDEVKGANKCANSDDTQFYEDLMESEKGEDDIEVYEWQSIGTDVDECATDGVLAVYWRTG